MLQQIAYPRQIVKVAMLSADLFETVKVGAHLLVISGCKFLILNSVTRLSIHVVLHHLAVLTVVDNLGVEGLLHDSEHFFLLKLVLLAPIICLWILFLRCWLCSFHRFAGRWFHTFAKFVCRRLSHRLSLRLLAE